MVRQLRAAVATLVVVGIGASAHTIADGATLPPVAVAVLVLLVGPVVWLLLRSRTSMPRMVLAIGAGQALTHLALVAMVPSTGGAEAAAHVHGATALSSTSSTAPFALHLSGSMLLAHVAATALAAVLLTRGEDVLRCVVRWLLPEVPAAPVPLRTCHIVADGDTRGLTGRAVRPVGGRGPPLLAC